MTFIPRKHDRGKNQLLPHCEKHECDKIYWDEKSNCSIKRAKNLSCVHISAVITWNSDIALYHYSFIHCRNKKNPIYVLFFIQKPSRTFLLISVKTTFHKDTQRVWHASVKAVSYFCKITTKSWLLKYVLLQKEEN